RRTPLLAKSTGSKTNRSAPPSFRRPAVLAVRQMTGSSSTRSKLPDPPKSRMSPAYDDLFPEDGRESPISGDRRRRRTGGIHHPDATPKARQNHCQNVRLVQFA